MGQSDMDRGPYHGGLHAEVIGGPDLPLLVTASLQVGSSCSQVQRRGQQSRHRVTGCSGKQVKQAKQAKCKAALSQCGLVARNRTA